MRWRGGHFLMTPEQHRRQAALPLVRWLDRKDVG
jgi:hypothetical protein